MTKKKVITIILILIVLITSVVCGFMVWSETPPKEISLSQEGLPTEDANLVAHRGFSAVAPENSDEAFIKAGEAESFAAECDIQLSKDNVWIVNHNDSIDDMTDGEGKISEMTHKEISEYFIDNGNYWREYAKQRNRYKNSINAFNRSI